MARMQDRIAIISGGARGIGEATVRLLHAEGAVVVIGDIETDLADALAAELGARALALRMDVTQADDWEAAVSRTIDRFGTVDVLVNNAGTTLFSVSVLNETAEGHRRLLDVNVTGAWSGMRAVLPHMKRQGRGSIVNISSIDGLAGVAEQTSYTASKYAVTGMTKAVALECRDWGVRVNSIHPGIIETPLVAKVPPEKRKRLDASLRRQPISRIGKPQDIAEAVLFFASDASSYCTGSSLVVDGGHLAGPYREPIE